MSYFPKTRAAAGYAASQGHGALTRGRAAMLVRRLRSCETALDRAGGRIPPADSGPLRDLVLAARDLAGRAWLAARADDPDVAAFTALESEPVSPAPADLDEVVSRVLWARFAPPAASRQHPGAADPSVPVGLAHPAQHGEEVVPGRASARADDADPVL